jgi:hypothetical protein
MQSIRALGADRRNDCDTCVGVGRALIVWQELPALSEEILEQGVIEQVLRLDDFCLSPPRHWGDVPGTALRVHSFLVRRRRTMALPA